MWRRDKGGECGVGVKRVIVGRVKGGECMGNGKGKCGGGVGEVEGEIGACLF